VFPDSRVGVVAHYFDNLSVREVAPWGSCAQPPGRLGRKRTAGRPLLYVSRAY